jgi:hypothetical protein
MRYFIDTEFIEGFFHSAFSKKHRHYVDLISIGIIAEDGREYYAISNEYRYSEASEWVKENVITPMYVQTVHGDARNQYSANDFHLRFGKNNSTIKEELLSFFGCWRDQHFWRSPEGIEVYGYFADYDWVLFCSLFGRMIDLPKGFPMYCRDLKQMMDERGLDKEWKRKNCPDPKGEHNALVDAKWNKRLFELINKEQGVQVSDTTTDHSSNADD